MTLQPLTPGSSRVRSLASLALVLAASCTSLPGPLNPLADQPDETLALPPAARPAPQEVEHVPVEDGADWLQLVSGEWLRGKLVRVRAGQLDFESDKLDDLEIDVDDVRSIRTAAPQGIVTNDNRALRGVLVIEGDDVWIAGQQTVLIRRDEVASVFPFDGDDGVNWSGSTTVGLTSRSGNTRQDDFSALLELTRETVNTRWANSYAGALSRADGNETANNHRLRSSYDLYLTQRLFLTLPSLGLYRDRYQNIDLRATPGAAVGYEVIDAATHQWILAIGPAYQYTRFHTTAPGADREDHTAAVAAFSDYTWDITNDIDSRATYAVTAALPETADYNHSFLVKLEFDLPRDLDLDVSFVWDRVNQPIADANGDRPAPDDYRTMIGLGWKF